MKHDSRIERMFETNQGWKDRQDSQRKLSFERKITRKLLDAGGVTILHRKVMEGKWDTDSQRDFYLTFGWMHETYPDFPFLLAGAEGDWTPRIIDVFTESARQCKLWSKWRSIRKEFSKEVVASHQVALMIPCSQESGLNPGLVMHNGTLPDGPFKDPVRNQIRSRMVDDKTGEWVYCQPLKYFAAQVALQWQA